MPFAAPFPIVQVDWYVPSVELPEINVAEVHTFDGDTDAPLGEYNLMKLPVSGAPLDISQVMTTGVPAYAVDVEAEAETSEGADAALRAEIVNDGPGLEVIAHLVLPVEADRVGAICGPVPDRAGRLVRAVSGTARDQRGRGAHVRRGHRCATRRVRPDETAGERCPTRYLPGDDDRGAGRRGRRRGRSRDKDFRAAGARARRHEHSHQTKNDRAYKPGTSIAKPVRPLTENDDTDSPTRPSRSCN